jgi:hypothetical protein
MLCRTSATCQRDDECELALANPEQLRVRGWLRQVSRDRGAAPLCGVLGALACACADRRASGRLDAAQFARLTAPPSQLATSMRTTASRCTTEALKAVLEVLCDEVSMVPPSMLAEIDKCLRVARGPHWRSSPPSSHRARYCVRLPSVPFAVARVCILSAMTTAQHVDDLILATQRAMERIR